MKEKIYKEMFNLCMEHVCANCPVNEINPKHKCGRGYGYSSYAKETAVPYEETKRYYLAIFEIHNTLGTKIKERQKEMNHG